MIWETSRMLLGLGIVLVLLFFFMKVLKKTHFVRGDLSADLGIRLLATKSIAPQKYISLVEIGGEVLALGVSEAQITLLTKIENKEFVEKMVARRPVLSEPSSVLQQISKAPRWLKRGALRISHGK